MPYIKADKRGELLVREPQSEGELNYVLTEEVLNYLDENGVSYATINTIVGVLECVKMEFYRRVAVPYENNKMAENGDVYGYEHTRGACVAHEQVPALGTVYIAGPMRGYLYFNFDAFFKAEEELHKKGYIVINPAKMDIESGFNPYHLAHTYDWNVVPPDFDFDACIDRDLEGIKSCDSLYLLRGWEDSTGARGEKALAEWLGKDVMYEV